MTIGNPSSPPADGRCIFLSIPRELRDQIYEDALTSSGPLHITLHKHETSKRIKLQPRASSNMDAPTVVPNPLREVSHQLCHETNGLEFAFNAIEFRCPSKGRGLFHFVRFLKHGSAQIKKWNKSITIYESRVRRYWPSTLTSSALTTFCHANPQTNVAVRIEHISQLRTTPIKFLKRCSSVHHLLNAPYPYYLSRRLFLEYIRTRAAEGEARFRERDVKDSLALKLPRNFEIFPGTDSFDKEYFVQLRRGRYSEALLDGDFERMAGVVRNWIENGLI